MEYPVCYHNTLPHVANAAKFDAVRYFYNEIHKIENVRQTKVKDFKKGLVFLLKIKNFTSIYDLNEM